MNVWEMADNGGRWERRAWTVGAKKAREIKRKGENDAMR